MGMASDFGVRINILGMVGDFGARMGVLGVIIDMMSDFDAHECFG